MVNVAVYGRHDKIFDKKRFTFDGDKEKITKKIDDWLNSNESLGKCDVWITPIYGGKFTKKEKKWFNYYYLFIS